MPFSRRKAKNNKAIVANSQLHSIRNAHKIPTLNRTDKCTYFKGTGNMKISDRCFSISIDNGKLEVSNKNARKKLILNFPGVCVSLGGKKIVPKKALGQARVTKKKISQTFEADGLRFCVSVLLTGQRWFKKTVIITSKLKLATPDFVEVDRQSIGTDELERCGYMATTDWTGKKGQLEGTGRISGCGYPLIGKEIFVGLEHPAGFSHVKKTSSKDTFWLRHHPVWDNGKLGQVDEVFGWAKNAKDNFADYLDTIRLKKLKKPLVSFCTFWSEPYVGNGKFIVHSKGINALIDAFCKLGLRPDVFTLDAGWNNLKSIFAAKKEVGGDDGLRKIAHKLEKLGIRLSLWLSHNGYVGIGTDYLKKKGFEVGSGDGAAYSGDGYGVMMDKRFEKLLQERFCELINTIGPRHFKIDWDNECATHAKFNKIYPTTNHVRQAGIDAFIRIGKAMRKADPNVVTRNGWWPSPWWLKEANHIWLCDSGDSEHCALPSRTQRDAASTHRDIMYYNVLQRDKSAVPLDCFDNHEFPDATQNPFAKEKGSWVNTAWLCFMRGSTYIALMQMPESLEDWQAKSLKQIMHFCRVYADNIFVRRGKMILGHPGKGQIYGFVHPGKNQSWCVLRNPRPIPQRIKIDMKQFVPHNVQSVFGFYPHYQNFKLKQEITLLAGELKILILSAKKQNTGSLEQYMVTRQGNKYLYHVPGSVRLNNTIRPLVHGSQLVQKLECFEAKQENIKNGKKLWWNLGTLHRMRQLEIQLCISSKNAQNLKVRTFSSRYPDGLSSYAIPVTEIPIGKAGHGEKRNLKETCRKDEIYYSIAIPDGGKFSVEIEITGAAAKDIKVSAWMAGFEDKSREAIIRKTAPAAFSKCLPYQHPLGFARALELPT